MLEDVKHEQNKQFKQFDSFTKKFESEKLYLVEDLKSKHRLEIENLKQSYSSNKEMFNEERKSLMDAHEAEINKLRQDMESLIAKSNKEKAEYEQNMLKLKAFHEKEMEASKNNSSSEYTKLINSLKDEMDALNKQKAAMEHDLKERYTKKIEEIIVKEEQIESLKKTIEEYKTNSADSNLKISNLSKEVMLSFFHVNFN
jgi:predicted  nucleic acid-binding Zn-ribbon protein